MKTIWNTSIIGACVLWVLGVISKSRLYSGLCRLDHWVVNQIQGSRVLAFLSRQGAFTKAFPSSLCCRGLSALCNVPATLLHALYRRWKTMWDQSFFATLAFRVGQDVSIAQGWFILALWIIPYENWNNTYTIVAFGILLMMFFVGSMNNQWFRVDIAAIGWCWVLMLFGIGLSAVITLEPAESLRYLVFHIAAALCVLVTVSGVQKERDLVRLAAASGGVVLIASAYGLFQRVQGVAIIASYVDLTLNEDMPGRVYSFFDNPNTFGQVLILLVPVVLALVVASRSPLGKIAALCASCMGVVALGMTYSRASWVGLAVALTAIIFFWKPRYVVLFVALGVAALPLLPDTIWNRILTIFNFSDSSTASRFPLYMASIEAIWSSPFIGAGLGTTAAQTLIKMRDVFQEVYTFIHAHNTYLQVWLETGLIGIVGLMGALFTQLKGTVHLMKQKKPSVARTIAYGSAAALLGAMVCGMADYVWHYPRVMMIFWFVFALTAASIKICLKEGAEQEQEIS